MSQLSERAWGETLTLSQTPDTFRRAIEHPYFRTPTPALFPCLLFFDPPFWKWRSVALRAFAPAGLFHARNLGPESAKEKGVEIEPQRSTFEGELARTSNNSRYPGRTNVVKLVNRT
jgi:hypothetical protein